MFQKVSWEDINSKGNPLLSPAYKSNGHVFTSGCLGTNCCGNLPEDVTEQTENAILNLEKVLKQSGSSLDKVIKVLLFISDRADQPAVNKVYKKYFTSKPARSCVIIGFPNPKVKVEVECIAQYVDLSSKL